MIPQYWCDEKWSRLLGDLISPLLLPDKIPWVYVNNYFRFQLQVV